MTFEQKIQEMLVANWMFESQAKEVINEMKKDKWIESMEGRWNDDISGYPDTIVNAMWFAAKTAALDYIEKNIPQAWFKPMFM